jgi:hypothetical protein
MNTEHMGTALMATITVVSASMSVVSGTLAVKGARALWATRQAVARSVADAAEAVAEST